MLLARICTLDGCLPQGSPTSPAIANIVCKRFDDEMLSYSISRGLRYTRYADDITISGDCVSRDLVKTIKERLITLGFKLNKEKTTILHDGSCKIVTGIVTNEKIQAPQKTRKEFRKNVHFIRKFGLDGHIARISENRRNYLRHLIGVGSFICWVNPNDKSSRNDLIYLRELDSAKGLHNHGAFSRS